MGIVNKIKALGEKQQAALIYSKAFIDQYSRFLPSKVGKEKFIKDVLDLAKLYTKAGIEINDENDKHIAPLIVSVLTRIKSEGLGMTKETVDRLLTEEGKKLDEQPEASS